MKPKSLLVLNEGYSDNLGDQAINESIHYLLNKNGITDIKFQDYTKNLDGVIDISISPDVTSKDSSILFKLVRMLPVKLRWLIRNLGRVIKVSRVKHDKVIIGGGQLVLSNDTFSIAMFSWVLFLRLFGNKRIYICGVGVGTEFSYLDRLLFKFSLKNITKIYLRDKKSQLTLMNIFRVESELIYDVAFIHNKLDCKTINDVESKSLLGVITYDVYRKYVSGTPLNKDAFFDTWITLLSESNVLLKNVKLFYTTKEDRVASIEFKQFVEKKYHIELPLIETSRLELLISEIKSSNIVISARMHALILGFTYDRKVVVYPISSKLIQFKKMIESDIALSDMQAVIESQFSNILNSNSNDEK